ncbi:MAG: hypothetical protein HDS68_01220 [Bacteroidales bacterium]|nr:hypothetical protein [Bacteroidales bacterium]
MSIRIVKKLVATLIVFIFAASAPTATGADDVRKRYELKVGDFTKLDVEDSFNVEYRCSHDSAGLAVYTTVPSLADKIIFENNNKGKLKIEKPFRQDGQLDEGLPTITVYSRFLKEVSNGGDSTVRVVNIRPTMEIKATVIGNGRVILRDLECSKFDGAIKTGNGTLVVTGKCENATLVNTGVGTIQADNLEANNVSAQFLGTGTTGCWPVETLKVKGVMSGKLYYRGNSAKIKNYSMGVKIYNLDGAEWKGSKEAEPADEKEK